MFKVIITAKGRLIAGALNLAARGFKSLVDEGMKVYVADVRDFLVSGIRGSVFTLAPLSEKYAGRKAIAYGAQPILMASGGYVNNIQVLEDPEGLRIGFRPGARAPNGTPYEDVALDLEMGTSTTPGRPHWRPTMEYAIQKAPTVGRAAIIGFRSRFK